MIELSVIIPSFHDPLLHNTIASLLENSELEDKLEVIPVLDGYWPETSIIDDDRVRIVHLGKTHGMREAINSGVRVARGRYIMRTDEHCMFAKGYDKVLTSQTKGHWIATPRRFYLDPVKWEVMDLPPVDYERLKIRDLNNGHMKFEGVIWRDRAKQKKHKMIDKTMSMQGSCWIMSHTWWDKVIGELQTEGYGPHYQDSHEMVFKTWRAGGNLVVNKNTWFAHKHVSFPRSHNYGSQDKDPNIDYCYNTWKDYYEQTIKPKWNI